MVVVVAVVAVGIGFGFDFGGIVDMVVKDWWMLCGCVGDGDVIGLW